MGKPKKSEKLLLQEIFRSGKNLLKLQRGLSIGQLIVLLRKQLQMPQRALTKRAGVTQSTISRIESGTLQPQIPTLEKIMGAMDCVLLITVVPINDLETIRKNQARAKAEQKIRYLHGTMSLEEQSPIHDGAEHSSGGS